ncbi:MAG: glycosyltransferase, partial [Planctomycetaceae bacterium]
MIALIGFDDDKVIKDFIRIHAEGLRAPVACLSGCYPDYQWRGLNVRKLHQEPDICRRLGSLLPYFINIRRLARMQSSATTTQKSLIRFFRSQNVDVILAEFGDTGAAIAPVAQQCQIPLIVHFHGHDAHRSSLLTPDMQQQYQLMFQTAAAVLVVSRFMWQTLADMGCPPEKLIYNPYGPRDKFFQIQP